MPIFNSSTSGGGASKIEHTVVITGTSAWLAPLDVTKAEVILCGGGGGGGGANTSSQSAGGGGSVAYNVLTVTPGTSYTVTIGAGGEGGSGILRRWHLMGNGESERSIYCRGDLLLF
jgi:hypothetical protein